MKTTKKKEEKEEEPQQQEQHGAVIGLITGSGMERMFTVSEPRRVQTDYGAVEVYGCSSPGEHRPFFLIPRHGTDHSIPPHGINFRGNVQAMKVLGVTDVIATSAVGSISGRVGIGGLGLVDQFLDFTKRQYTFFADRPVHVDITYPYDRGLQGELSRAASELGIGLARGLVYVSVEGPRYETAAEIRMFAQLGGDVVGMTGAPEATLCREAGLRYASVVIATNLGAGMQDRVSHDEVVRVMEKVRPTVRSLLERTIDGWKSV